ncbi:glycosyl transferase [Echinicola pacifica]|uniref:Glycosyl transferase n=1 Tax=Echinicola pacifica TaxID=346377 RepID=A0A918QAK5_9BACT|nr:glycosyltransferase family 4 protein [Echinicola pacifica]GGZ37897.1 glycosyl transferase [Echinicola pacifica]
MRIVVVNATTDLYGANRILSLALRAFPKQAKIDLLLPEIKGPLIKHIEDENPNVSIIECDSLPIIQRKMFSPVGFIQAVKLLLKFKKFLRSENSKQGIDLIYINTLSNFLVLPIAHILNINTIVHVHEILESPKFISRVINKYSLQWSTSVLAVSNAVKKNLLVSGPAYDNKVEVIHNGIPDLFQPLERKNDTCIITLIARIKPEKGIWYFLEAINLLENQDNIIIRIIGGAAPFGEKYIDKLKEDIAKSKVKIEFIDFTPNVSRYLNETDILVVPSIMKDPFPTTVLEGMSCGKLVIATNTGGAVEAIIDGETGYLIPKDEPQIFSTLLDKLIIDSELRDKLGINARQRYLNNFSINSYVDNLQVYISNRLSL